MAGASMSPIPFRGMVKTLILVNLAVWVIQIVVGKLILGDASLFSQYLGLVPYEAVFKLHIWQLFTYQFLHSLSPHHILLNMLVLWWAGTDLENLFGRKEFLRYYLISGVGAGVVYCIGYILYYLITGNQSGILVPVIGASGATFGLLLAYGILFGERTLYLFMTFPMKAKYMVAFIGGIELMWLISGAGAGVANLAHLGGLLAGFVYLLWKTKKKQNSRKPKRSKSRPSLHLVVDENKDDEDNPRYWN